MIRAVIFDFANTLFDYEVFMEKSWPIELRVLHGHENGISRMAYINARKKALSTPNVYWRTLEYWATILEELNLENNLSLCRKLLNEFNRFSKPLILKMVKPYPESRYVLRSIRVFGFNTGIVSNLTEWEAKFLERYDLRRYFDSVIISEIVKVRKPSLKPFLLALKDLGCRPDEAIMVGDRYDIDVAPAKVLGMKTIRIRRGWFANQQILRDEMKPDYEVSNLLEVLKVIRELVM